MVLAAGRVTCRRPAGPPQHRIQHHLCQPPPSWLSLVLKGTGTPDSTPSSPRPCGLSHTGDVSTPGICCPSGLGSCVPPAVLGNTPPTQQAKARSRQSAPACCVKATSFPQRRASSHQFAGLPIGHCFRFLILLPLLL